MNKVLIIIDAQEDFTRGALRNEEAIRALPVLHDVAEYAAANFDHPVFYTQDTHSTDYMETQEGRNLPVPHCIPDTAGWKVCPEARAETGGRQIELRKRTFGFLEWESNGFPEHAEEIWLCGFCTDICVSANFQILKATYPEIPIIVIEDACAGVTPELHEAALKVMRSCQAEVVKWNDLKRTENAGRE